MKKIEEKIIKSKPGVSFTSELSFGGKVIRNQTSRSIIALFKKSKQLPNKQGN